MKAILEYQLEHYYFICYPATAFIPVSLLFWEEIISPNHHREYYQNHNVNREYESIIIAETFGIRKTKKIFFF